MASKIQKEPENCWDFLKCSKQIRKKCPAYTTDSGRECWMVANSFREGKCPKIRKEFNSCLECDWFKKLNPEF